GSLWLCIFLVTVIALGDNLRPLGLEGGLVLDGAFGRLRSRAKLVEAGDQIGLFVKGCGQRIGLAYLGIIWEQILRFDRRLLDRLLLVKQLFGASHTLARQEPSACAHPISRGF